MPLVPDDDRVQRKQYPHGPDELRLQRACLRVERVGAGMHDRPPYPVAVAVADAVSDRDSIPVADAVEIAHAIAVALFGRSLRRWHLLGHGQRSVLGVQLPLGLQRGVLPVVGLLRELGQCVLPMRGRQYVVRRQRDRLQGLHRVPGR